IPETVPCTSVNKVCGSGLKTVAMATQAVLLGDADIVVAGGMENMSASPFLLPKGRYGYKMGDGAVVDHMIRDGLWCAL
ncbi:MAG: beta-ketoacyl synthase N-terminal-like domain-containing protein, partial [Actinomycetota bacterium]|nr:beta-ketoacyl synthase N-terminal-like domain-containing protein [Actinomycetota bacterium]